LEKRTQKHRRAAVFAVRPKPRRSSASTQVPLSRYAHSRSATYLTVLLDVPVRIPYEATPIATATHTSWGFGPAVTSVNASQYVATFPSDCTGSGSLNRRRHRIPPRVSAPGAASEPWGGGDGEAMLARTFEQELR
jgi:hypothetical protein